MTVICWDGTTLAADREASDNWIKCNSATKIAILRGHLAGWAGPAAICAELAAWFGAGADPATFHDSLRKAENANLLVITPERVVHLYQNSPYPIVYRPGAVTGHRYALGCGKEAAMAVMLAGNGARRAVEIAALVCAGVGNGIDTLELP